MLDIHLVRKQLNEVKRKIASKNINPRLLDTVLKYDEVWRTMKTDIDGLRGKQHEYEKVRDFENAKKTKIKIDEKEKKAALFEQKRMKALLEVPNIPFDDVPIGSDENGNKVIREVGKKPVFDFEPKDHLELGEQLGIIDTKKAAEVAGSRFSYLKKEAALLEFALVRLAFDKLMLHGFVPIVPPVMIREEAFMGMGRLTPSQKEERYHLQKDKLYLVGSAEHTIGPLHMNEIFDEKQLPLRYVGFSSCFRREAGSYGKDTRGILRVHQFDKIEMFSFVRPEDSEEEHKFLLSMQEALMQELELPYRVMEICTGDMGFTDARQYDIECFMPAQGKFRETNSCSNTTDFQARGVNIKYRKTSDQKVEFVHMLNATGFAIGRMIVAILENYQTKEGIVRIPRALQAYVGSKEIQNVD